MPISRSDRTLGSSATAPPRLPHLTRLALLLWVLSSGCASLTNPVKRGIPVESAPSEWLAPPRDPLHPLPVSLLGQRPPAVYRLAPGDLLAVWVDGVLGKADERPPVIQPVRATEPPALGFPFPVREDGTILLPLVPPIPAAGKSIAEVEAAVRKAYRDAGILKAGKEQVLVTLLRKRLYHVVVVRDEVQNFNTTGGEASTVVIASTQKRGNGHVIDLPAYENDVLNALGRSGGPPGLDAYNAVIVEHKSRAAQWVDPDGTVTACLGGPHIVRIPLRVPPEEEPKFSREDVILDDGDVVYLEARDQERFYTGGLLPPGEYVLPRDYDLDVVRAVAFVKGPLLNGAFGGSNLSGRLVEPGIGGPSPRLLTVLRKLPDGHEVALEVDLFRALHDPSVNILVQPGDLLILQDTPAQGVARFLGWFLDRLYFNFGFQTISRSSTSTGRMIFTPQ
jgi:Polysaccharide biosynthesis/export protein